MTRKILFILFLSASSTCFAKQPSEVKARLEVIAAKKEMKKALKRGDQATYAIALEKMNSADTRFQKAVLRRNATKPGRRLANENPTRSRLNCSMPRQEIPRCNPGDTTCDELTTKLVGINKEIDAHEAACRKKMLGGVPARVEYSTNGAPATNDAPQEATSPPVSAAGGAL